MRKVTLILLLFLSSCMKQSDSSSSVPGDPEHSTSQRTCEDLVTDTLRFNGAPEMELINNFITKTHGFENLELTCLDKYLALNCLSDKCSIHRKIKDDLK